MTGDHQECIEALRETYKDADERKYLSTAIWVPINQKRVMALGLDAEPPRRVLDLGCGAGYFAHLCRMRGHEVVASDIAERAPLYVDVTRILGLPVVPVDIKAFAPLPELGMFDVITAFMVCFNGHRQGDGLWKVHEWTFFLDDLQARLRTGGVICIELNRELDTNTCYTPELEAFFVSRGAIFTGHYPHAPMPGGHRVVFGQR